MAKGKVIFGSRKDYISLLRDLFLDLKKKIRPLDNNLNPWFLIRIQTGYFFHLIYSGKLETKEERIEFDFPRVAKASLKSRLIKCYRQLNLYLEIQRHHKILSGKLKNKTLYLGYHSHNIRNGSYNIYLHPFYEEDTERGEIFYMDLKNNDKDLQYYYQLLLKYYTLKSGFRHKKIAYENSKLIQEVLKAKNNIESSVLNSNNFSTLSKYPVEVKAYNKFLKTISPKQVLFYCYYDQSINAMSFAAGELGIPTIEYQHSNITDTHFAYADWENVDEVKSNFPTIFYVWEEADKELILRNFSGKTYLPKVEVVGNRYLQKSIQESNTETEDSHKNVLICLQGQWIPDFLEEFIYKDEEYTWYFRLHPRYPQDNDKLKDFLVKKTTGIVVERANSIELYDLFKETSVLMTSFSGTALEAEKFGKKVIIFGEEGYNSYADKIKSKIYFYIENKEDIIKSISWI